jgi:hypothetical protein
MEIVAHGGGLPHRQDWNAAYRRSQWFGAHQAHCRYPLAGDAAREAATRVYTPELDAAVTGGGVALPMTSREEVILTATSPSWLRTTWPAARRKMGWIPPCFEGQSMTISR